MQGRKYSDELRESALEMLQQAYDAGMTQTQACESVASQFLSRQASSDWEDAPSVHTLRYWGASWGIFAGLPGRRATSERAAGTTASGAESGERGVDDFDRIVYGEQVRTALLAEHESAAAEWDSERSGLLTEIEQLRAENAQLCQEKDAVAQLAMFYLRRNQND
ncbi:hypothetical protein IU459_32640 [Nocardia amamiensis]|uniref:Transposase n=1 Tax=Nocardia amamiensis TaxID=404578 RepID=A0ABS0D2B2_9NOCA|nr:hypothetical protein [Nocardia amamiensis]MBF6302253.1 hypothetical protein [Nocardia amamiensis]